MFFIHGNLATSGYQLAIRGTGNNCMVDCRSERKNCMVDELKCGITQNVSLIGTV